MKLKTGYTPNKVRIGVRSALLAAAAAGAMTPSPGLAQEQDQEQGSMPMDEVVVTGSILRRTDAETPSPVTVLSSESLEQRGINTISEAVQRLSSNNAGTIQQGWNTGFNFAAGANAPALRGLTVQATLSVADGLRLAPYPLADDGHRNFVDLNTIPNAIIDRIEVLRDGASSTYGADAIAGVINVITKREIQGLHLGGSKGISQDGGGDENRMDVTWGVGDLESQGYNFYVSGEYQKQDVLWARDRGFPFNTSDWSRICGESPLGDATCMQNLNQNSLTGEMGNIPSAFNGLFVIPGVTLVRPATGALDGTLGETGSGRFQFLNAEAGCRQWKEVTINPITAPNVGHSNSSPLTTCELNRQAEYIMLQPEIKRTGASSRVTVKLGESAELYAMANYYETDTFASFTPIGFNGRPAVPRPGDLSNYNVILPEYVCAEGIGTPNGLNTGCDETNGQLNPYNPFAAPGAAGSRAQAFFGSPFGRTEQTESRALRGVLGVNGTIGDSEKGWRYSADYTASEVGLRRIEGNYYIPQRIMDVVARGQFNFMNPLENSQEVWDYISPESNHRHTSRLWQVQATLAKEFFELPGGAMQAALGVSYREEELNQISANPANDAEPYSRYYAINAVGAVGERDVKSGFFEVSAPILEQLELAASGRYDEYSSGQSNFSPKFGFKVTPIEQIAVRGTWSKGFRIPSFNEAFGLPTTGYVTAEVECLAAGTFCADHGNNGYATGQYSVGLTSIGNPDLEPETSTSFTAGLVIEPRRNLSFTLDYWNIEVEDLIKGVAANAELINEWYTNGGDPGRPGIVMLAGAPDTAFPNALPLLGFIQASFANLQSQEANGIDIGANFTLPLGDKFTWRSTLDASYLLKFEQTDENGVVMRYEGTLSPCDVTSCSGSPKLRGMWQNSLDIGATTVSLTAYYTSGYDTASVDYGGVKGDCQGNAAAAISTASYAWADPDLDRGLVAPVNCKQKAQWNADLTARHKFDDKYTVYLDVLNVFNIKPEFDPSAAYGLFGFNPAWGGPNAMGRYFRVGAKFDF